MKLSRAAVGLWGGIVSAGVSTIAFALPVQIDLTQFTVYGSTISVASDGSSAQLQEDPAQFAVFLFNDPGMGDPALITPGTDTYLQFDYVFNEAFNNDDFFQAYLYEAGNYSLSPAFEASSSGSGTVEFDLSAYLGMTLGLDFVLASNDFDLGSFVTVSNLRLDQRSQPPTQVPEPAIGYLFGLGLVLIWWRQRYTTRAT